MRVVVLDDYQGLAEQLDLAGQLTAAGVADAGLVVVREHLDGTALVTALVNPR